MEVLVSVIHVLSALAIVGLVLVQQGKGADMGASFGGGASGTLFGASGSANFLSRSTATLAVVFFVSSLALAWLGAHQIGGSSLKDQPAATATAPATAPAPAAAPKTDQVPK